VTRRAYENFDVLIESIGDDALRARVTQSNGGDPPAQPFTLPFNADQLENLLLKVDPTRSSTRRLMAPRAQASADLGGGLYDSLFRDGIGIAWSRSVQTAREHRHGVRLRLRLADAPQVAGLPWELLYDRRTNHYLAKSERTPIVRYLDVDNPPEPLTVQGGLRILVIICSPVDLPALDVEREWQRVSAVLADRAAAGTVAIDRLPQPTLGALQEWLRHHDVHVLHFIGHGAFDRERQEGVLAFADAYGHSRPVSSEEIGKYVRDHDPLRLVVLNACQTATTDTVDTYSGIAQGLVQQEAPAVVAMQYPISDGAAIAFASGFYGALTDGDPVDQAISCVRKTLSDDFGDEWMTPVLFLRAGNGEIFDQIPPAASVPADAPPVADEPATVPEAPVAPERGADSAASVPGHRRFPSRRGRWIAIAALLILVAAGAVVTVVKMIGTSAVYPIGASKAPVYTGPSKRAFVPAGSFLSAHQRVTLVCAVYGGIGPDHTFLWYRVGSGYVHASYVVTGSTAPKVNECIGKVSDPSVGGALPTPDRGPFVIIGTTPQPTYHHPNTGDPAGGFPPGALVEITCAVRGSTVHRPGPGGADSNYWDQLNDGRWIPHAVLLYGGVATPRVPRCSAAG
jgi:hypothetical protein